MQQPAHAATVSFELFKSAFFTSETGYGERGKAADTCTQTLTHSSIWSQGIADTSPTIPCHSDKLESVSIVSLFMIQCI